MSLFESTKLYQGVPVDILSQGQVTVEERYIKNLQKANDKQVAGDHYKQFKGHEPWDVVIAWGLGYLDGTALKYISRWKHKGGVEDLKKAIHFLEKLVEEEEKNGLHRAY